MDKFSVVCPHCGKAFDYRVATSRGPDRPISQGPASQALLQPWPGYAAAISAGNRPAIEGDLEHPAASDLSKPLLAEDEQIVRWKVGSIAALSPANLLTEVLVGAVNGKTYDDSVLDIYRRYGGYEKNRALDKALALARVKEEEGETPEEGKTTGLVTAPQTIHSPAEKLVEAKRWEEEAKEQAKAKAKEQLTENFVWQPAFREPNSFGEVNYATLAEAESALRNMGAHKIDLSKFNTFGGLERINRVVQIFQAIKKAGGYIPRNITAHTPEHPSAPDGSSAFWLADDDSLGLNAASEVWDAAGIGDILRVYQAYAYRYKNRPRPGQLLNRDEEAAVNRVMERIAFGGADENAQQEEGKKPVSVGKMVSMPGLPVFQDVPRHFNVGGVVNPAFQNPAFKQWFGDWENEPAWASKVVTEQGVPQVVYHGTNDTFDRFSPGDAGRHGTATGLGFYFAEHPQVSDNFAQEESYRPAEQSGGNVIPAFLNIRNPFDFEALFSLSRMSELHPALARSGPENIDRFQRFVGARQQPGEDYVTGYDLWHSIKDTVGSQGANAILKAAGYDGIVHKARDTAGTASNPRHPGPHINGNVWVAFEPTQIKSAIANQGTYDPADPRIHMEQGGLLDVSPDAFLKDSDYRRAWRAAYQDMTNFGIAHYPTRETADQALTQRGPEWQKKYGRELENFKLSVGRTPGTGETSDMAWLVSASGFDPFTPAAKSARTTPAPMKLPPEGTWKIDDQFRGMYGHYVEQLRFLDPNELILPEGDLSSVAAARQTGADFARLEDAQQYAQWLKQGLVSPPISVLETESGKLRVSDGHRRAAAAKIAGVKVPAWVSPTVDTFQKDYEGKPIKTGLTYELAVVRHAVEHGLPLPQEILKQYPELHTDVLRHLGKMPAWNVTHFGRSVPHLEDGGSVDDSSSYSKDVFNEQADEAIWEQIKSSLSHHFDYDDADPNALTFITKVPGVNDPDKVVEQEIPTTPTKPPAKPWFTEEVGPWFPPEVMAEINDRETWETQKILTAELNDLGSVFEEPREMKDADPDAVTRQGRAWLPHATGGSIGMGINSPATYGAQHFEVGGKISSELRPKYKALRAAVAAGAHTTGEGFKHTMQLARHALRSDDVLRNIPAGSSFLGAGIAGLAFRTPQGDVVRLQPSNAQAICERAAGEKVDPKLFSTYRPKIQEVLQPTAAGHLPTSVEGKSVYFERLPFAPSLETIGMPYTQSNQVITDLDKSMRGKGYTFFDAHAGNVGVQGLFSGQRRYVIIDPGAIQSLGHGGDREHEFSPGSFDIMPSGPVALWEKVVGAFAWVRSKAGFEEGGQVVPQHFTEGSQEVVSFSIPSWLGTPSTDVGIPHDIAADFRPEFMSSPPGHVQGKVSNELLAKGVPVKEAYARAHKVARFVDNYSLHRPQVYERVLRNLQNQVALKGTEFDYDRAREIAADAASQAEPYHQQMVGYLATQWQDVATPAAILPEEEDWEIPLAQGGSVYVGQYCASGKLVGKAKRKFGEFGESKAHVATGILDWTVYNNILGTHLGNYVDPRIVASLAGAPDNARVIVETDAGKVIAEVHHPDLDEPMIRHIGLNNKGELYIKNVQFFLKDLLARQGVGASYVARQVENAQNYGVSYITTHAAGNYQTAIRKDRPLAGYTVWPKYGFDQEVAFLPERLRKKVAKKFPKARTILDVVATLQGADWWFKNGSDLHYARFDLSPESRSMEVFRAYGERTGKYAEGDLVQAIPPEPGTAQIPKGHVRLFHYTRGDIGKVGREGLKLEHAKGHTYGEPDLVWASTRIPDRGHNIVEFHVPADDDMMGLERPDKGQDLDEWQAGHHHVGFRRDIGPEEILAIHQPWHQNFHYIEQSPSVLKATLAGEHDHLLQYPEYSNAIVAIKNKYSPMAQGGRLGGQGSFFFGGGRVPGSGTTDSFYTTLAPGSFVLNAGAVKAGGFRASSEVSSSGAGGGEGGVPVVLAPGEIVYTPSQVQQIGLGTLQAWNQGDFGGDHLDRGGTPEAKKKFGEFGPSKASVNAKIEDMKAFEELLGSSDPSLCASLVGAPDNSLVDVVMGATDPYITVRVVSPDVIATRRISQDIYGQPYLENVSLKVKGGTGQGVGTAMFARQVENAQKYGFDRIEAYAAGAKDDPNYNGYYTWPRVGFELPLGYLDPPAAEKVKEKFPEAKTILDVMATPEGRAYWKEHGSDLFGMVFDLSPHSRSMQVFKAYGAESGKWAQGGFIHNTPQRFDEGGEVQGEGQAHKPPTKSEKPPFQGAVPWQNLSPEEQQEYRNAGRAPSVEDLAKGTVWVRSCKAREVKPGPASAKGKVRKVEDITPVSAKVLTLPVSLPSQPTPPPVPAGTPTIQTGADVNIQGPPLHPSIADEGGEWASNFRSEWERTASKLVEEEQAEPKQGDSPAPAAAPSVQPPPERLAAPYLPQPAPTLPAKIIYPDADKFVNLGGQKVKFENLPPPAQAAVASQMGWKGYPAGSEPKLVTSPAGTGAGHIVPGPAAAAEIATDVGGKGPAAGTTKAQDKASLEERLRKVFADPWFTPSTKAKFIYSLHARGDISRETAEDLHTRLVSQVLPEYTKAFGEEKFPDLVPREVLHKLANLPAQEKSDFQAIQTTRGRSLAGNVLQRAEKILGWEATGFVSKDQAELLKEGYLTAEAPHLSFGQAAAIPSTVLGPDGTVRSRPPGGGQPPTPPGTGPGGQTPGGPPSSSPASGCVMGGGPSAEDYRIALGHVETALQRVNVLEREHVRLLELKVRWSKDLKLDDLRRQVAAARATTAFLHTPAGREHQREILRTQLSSRAETARATREEIAVRRETIGTPEHLRMIREETALRKEQVRISREGRMQLNIENFGPVLGRLKELNQRFEEFPVSIARAFTVGTAAITGFVHAASPDAFDTFTGSLQLVSGEIGMAFLPAIMKVSSWVQTAADWIKNLDTGTKETMGSFAAWGVGLAGVSVAASKVVSIVTTLTPALKALGSGLATAGSALLSFAMAHPVISALAGIGAAAYATASYCGIVGSSARDAGDRIMAVGHHRRNILALRRGPMTRELYEETVPLELREQIERVGDGGVLQQGPVQPGRTMPRATPIQIEEARRNLVTRMVEERDTRITQLQATNPSQRATQIEAALQGQLAREPRGLLQFGGRSNATILDEYAMQARMGYFRGGAELAPLINPERLQEAQRRRIFDTPAALGLPENTTVGGREHLQAIASFLSGGHELARLVSEREALRNVQQRGVPGVVPGAAANANLPPDMSRGEVKMAVNWQNRQIMDPSSLHDIIQQEAVRNALEQVRFEQQMRALERIASWCDRQGRTLDDVARAIEEQDPAVLGD